MARVPSVAQTDPTFRPLTTAVRKLAVAGRCCANCGSLEIRPSYSRNALDVLLACLFLAPFRCRVCRGRFYRMWRPSLQRSPDPSGAPLMLISVRRTPPSSDSVEPPLLGPELIHPRNNEPKLLLRPGATDPIPIEIAPAPVGDLPGQPLPPATPAPILILESDFSIRKLLCRLLERRGYSTVEVAQVEDLAGEMLDRRVDLLIVDVSTVEDGVQAVVKLARALPSLKVLALSAEPLFDNEIPERLLVLPKPFPLDSFVDSVDCLMKPSSPRNTSL
jgi:CheY-like chemotaxis protein